VNSRPKVSRATDYLEHIFEAISRIERYAAGLNLQTFLADEKSQDAIIRNIEIAGEAAGILLRDCPDFCLQHQDIPWETIYGMRNRLIHGYAVVNLDVVWNTVTTSLPALKSQIAPLL
jgi:uncharacterized protein with HEPN domain